MKISGTSTLEAPVDKVWEAILDPAVLARCIPGCEALRTLGEDRYAMSVTAGVAAIKGTYAGEVSLADMVAPHSLTMKASGAGAPGTIDADVKVRLVPSADGGTELTYDADASVGGAIGGVGQRMLAGVTKKMAGQFFTALDQDIAGVLLPAGAAGTAGAHGAPGRSRRRRPVAGARHPRRVCTPVAPPRRARVASTSAPVGASRSARSSVACWPWPASRSAHGSGGGPDARLHRGRRAGRTGRRPADRRVGRRPTPPSSSTSPAAASRPPAPTSSCCPSRRPPGSRPGAPRSSCGSSSPSCPGRSISPLRDVAAELGIHLVVGTYERGPSPEVVYNSSVLIDPAGEVLGVYRKTHPFCSEAVSGGGWVTPGDTVTVCDTALGRIGMIICFDGDYPELSRIEAVQGAEVICRPSALLRSADIWELTSRARAYDNHVFVIGANAVGQDPAGVLYFGNSHIVTPIGHIVAKAATHEGWVSARLDPEQALTSLTPGSNISQGFDHLRDRNLDLIRNHREELEGPAKTSFPHA